LRSSIVVEEHAQPFHAEAAPGPDGTRGGVLLVHGFTGSPYSMRPWGEYLASRGLAVAVPRLPGHGTTWQQMNRTRWQDWYDEVTRAFDKLRANCDRVVAGGLSMGGALALRLAEDRGDEVTGLVLVNPALTNESTGHQLVPLLQHVVPSTKGVTNDIKKPDVDEHGYGRSPLKAAASMFTAWRQVIADLPKVTQPLLMFRSTDDHVVPASSGRYIMTRVSSTDLSERLLENSYHVATLDYDAPAIFAESEQFVRRVTGP
jgi:carboxylesterase